MINFGSHSASVAISRLRIGQRIVGNDECEIFGCFRALSFATQDLWRIYQNEHLEFSFKFKP